MQLAIDCASDEPGLALAVDGVAALTLAWRTERNHSSELLPNIERLLAEAQRDKSAISAVFVDVGPGGYAALRVGVSTAKALAHALGVPIAGVGRLELDAHGVAAHAAGRRIVALHRAGRGELAWAAYRDDRGFREESPPAIAKVDDVRARLRADDVLCGDGAGALDGVTQPVLVADQHRVAALAARGHARIAAGRADDATTLVPLYLRAPAIGPQSGSA